ncbi:unnamed protein product, partial [Laminaria digitata]
VTSRWWATRWSSDFVAVGLSFATVARFWWWSWWWSWWWWWWRCESCHISRLGLCCFAKRWLLCVKLILRFFPIIRALRAACVCGTNFACGGDGGYVRLEIYSFSLVGLGGF